MSAVFTVICTPSDKFIRLSTVQTVTEENLTTKRPGDGISPMKWHQVLGQKAVRDFALDEQIQL